MSNGFHEEVESYLDKEGFVEIEITQYLKNTYGEDGDIRVQTHNGSYGAQPVWLDIAGAKRLRKQLKRAIEFLES